MKRINLVPKVIFSTILLCSVNSLHGFYGTDLAENQTPTVNLPISGEDLPFTLRIEKSDLEFPKIQESNPKEITAGVQGYAFASYGDKWVILSGRTTGLHSFSKGILNFSAKKQNKYVYVIDTIAKTIKYKSLQDPSSGLSTEEIDLLSVNVPQSAQVDDYLYIIGGYGIDTKTNTFGTKPTLSKLHIPSLINWVETGKENIKDNLQQLTDSIFQVTGGEAFSINDKEKFLVCLGQNFNGVYGDKGQGIYTKQIRKFKLSSDQNSLRLIKATKYEQKPDYRRRDLSIVPIALSDDDHIKQEFVALAGVFTESGGCWTVPIFIDSDGESHMDNPAKQKTFKQGMNTYNCANISLYSEEKDENFILLFGGISLLYKDGKDIKKDTAFPFINAVTTLSVKENRIKHQYLMENSFPKIQYPGKETISYFGANAKFIPIKHKNITKDVICYDSLKDNREILIGHIVGGIQSSARNTGGVDGSSMASPYIFNVYLTKK